MKASSSKRQRKTGSRRYIRMHAASIFTIVMLLLGGGMLSSYILAPPNEIAPPREGLGAAMSNAVNVDTLQLGLDTQQPNPELVIYIQIHLSYVPPSERKPAYVMLVLPFVVNTVLVSDSQHWNVVSSSKCVATMIYTQVSNDSSHLNSTFFSADFRVDRTFESSQRDIHTVVLPFGVGLTALDEYFPEVDQVAEQLGIGIRSPPANLMNIYLTLPQSAENVQPFPEPKSRTPYVEPRYMGNQTKVSVDWVLTEAQTITISYDDSYWKWVYETYAILGSLLVGVGASGVLDWLERLSKQDL